VKHRAAFGGILSYTLGVKYSRRNFVVLCCIFVAVAATVQAQWRRVSEGYPAPSVSFAGEILFAHNEVRARLAVPPLQWSDGLAAHAQDWADRLLREGQFYHRPHPLYGENLLEITGGRISPAQVIGDWASEERDYSFSTNTCRGVCGHYTQLIWSATREVGCAVARDSEREVWVCNYNPPGNWVGEFPN
jgi:pathogenesis-related protein 1